MPQINYIKSPFIKRNLNLPDTDFFQTYVYLPVLKEFLLFCIILCFLKFLFWCISRSSDLDWVAWRQTLGWGFKWKWFMRKCIQEKHIDEWGPETGKGWVGRGREESKQACDIKLNPTKSNCYWIQQRVSRERLCQTQICPRQGWGSRSVSTPHLVSLIGCCEVAVGHVPFWALPFFWALPSFLCMGGRVLAIRKNRC